MELPKDGAEIPPRNLIGYFRFLFPPGHLTSFSLKAWLTAVICWERNAAGLKPGDRVSRYSVMRFACSAVSALRLYKYYCSLENVARELRRSGGVSLLILSFSMFKLKKKNKDWTKRIRRKSVAQSQQVKVSWDCIKGPRASCRTQCPRVIQNRMTVMKSVTLLCSTPIRRNGKGRLMDGRRK